MAERSITLDTPDPLPGRMGAKDLLLSLRPSQWTKNAIVLAALFFAFWDLRHPRAFDWRDLADVLLAAALFCVVSSGVYLVNDIADIRTDRAHPIRRRRPIAAGRVPVPAAAVTALALLAGAGFASGLLPPEFRLAVAGYIGLQLAYTFAFKRLAFVDIIVIAVGFVLRAIAGALAIHVYLSPWLLLCAFLLALFLALCKRRHEKAVVADLEPEDRRPGLESYDRQVMDIMIAVVSGATVVAYAMYTLSPETVAKFNTAALGFTIPFVVFGIFRYLDLVYRHRKGSRPEQILLTDLPTMLNVVFYAVSVVVIFLLTR
ncbi:MAG: decaprenyl-phosphate phosphoribosyltransferase [Verrucomicrobiota bacterium]|nr:decaprenyl-phosphate phosphoribosyltransferase [Verrucomicrobiota bacterium]